MAGPRARAISVSEPQRAVLEQLLRQHTCPQALALRVRIVLGLSQAAGIEVLAARLACSSLTVTKWRDRWADAESLLGAAEVEPGELRSTIETTLADAARSGRPVSFSAEQVVQIVNLACSSPRSFARPIDAWTPRELAEEAKLQGIVTSISASSVNRFLGTG